MKIIEKNLNIETGEETLIEREETPDELKSRLEFEANAQAQALAKSEAEAMRAIAQAKLGALGLTTDDLKALGL
jgi:hypothetical protein